MEDQTPTSGIGIYPSFFMLTLKEGERKNLSVSIRNFHSIPIRVTPSGGEFEQNPYTLLNSIISHDTFTDWITAKEIVIPPNSTSDLDFSVVVAEDVPEGIGSYYPALILTFDPPQKIDGSFIRFESAIPLYVEISENAAEELDVVSFSTEKYVLGTSAVFNTNITNSGNTYATPRAYIELSSLNILNDQDRSRIETLPVNIRRATILPESILQETTQWEQKQFGHYESVLFLSTGQEDIAVKSIDFWIIPPSWILIATGIIALAIATVIAIRLRHLRKKLHKGNSTPKQQRHASQTSITRLQKRLTRLLRRG